MAISGRYYWWEWYKNPKDTFRDGMRIVIAPFSELGESGILAYDNVGSSDVVSYFSPVTRSYIENASLQDYCQTYTGLFFAEPAITVEEFYNTAPFYRNASDNIGSSDVAIIHRTLLAFETWHADDFRQYGPGISAYDSWRALEFSDSTSALGYAETIYIQDAVIMAFLGSGTSQYRDGRVTVVDGSDIVYGIDTFFQKYVQPGALFQIVPDTAWYEVASAVNSVRLKLSDAYHGAGSANVNYVVHQLFSLNRKIPLLSKYDEQWNEIYNRAIRIIDKEVNDLLQCMYYHPYTKATIESYYVSESVAIIVNSLYDAPYEGIGSGDYVVCTAHPRIFESVGVSESVTIA